MSDLPHAGNCPFCGSPDFDLVPWRVRGSEIFNVRCSRCHGQGPPAVGKDAAIFEWNQRVREPVLESRYAHE